MRPKLLDIEGLQSFKARQRIDFEQLGETGLFGIFGPTGSGKSTVLDAITLALYGRVKRAERGTQGIINANLDNARVAFTFELLQGNERTTYRVERSFQRKKGTENSCEPKVVRLIQVTPAGEIALCDKTTEVTGTVERLLGLSHDDFTRAVVLPQNSFHEFLFLENAKKREMLERIFYLEEYGRLLTDKLSRKMTIMKSTLDMLLGELNAYADATDEALAVSQKEMEAAIGERARVEKEAKLLEEKFVQAKEIWQHTQELAFILEREEQHHLMQEEINEKRRKLDKAVKAQGLMDKIKAAEDLKVQLEETQKQLAELLQALPESEQNHKTVRETYEALKKEISIEQPRLIELKTRLSDALILREDIQVLEKKRLAISANAEKAAFDIAVERQQYDKRKQALEDLNQSVGIRQKELASLQTAPVYREQVLQGVALENDVQIKKAACTELEAEILRLNTTIQGFEQQLKLTREKLLHHRSEAAELNLNIQQHFALMPEGRNEQDSLKDQMNALNSGLQVLKIRQGSLKQADIKVLRLDGSVQTFENQVNTTQQNLDSTAKTLESSRLEVEQRVREYEKKTAYTLSLTLKQGEPCPVCGSPDHPSPAVHADENGGEGQRERLEAARQKLEEHEKAFKEIEKKLLIAQEKLHAEKLQRDQAWQEKEVTFNQLRAEKDKLPQEYRDMELEQLEAVLETRKASFLEKQRSLEDWERKKEEFQALLKKQEDTLKSEEFEENKLAAQCEVNKTNLKQLEESLAAKTAELTEKDTEYSDFLKNLGLASASAEQKRLAESDKKAELIQNELAQKQREAELEKTTLEQLREAIQAKSDSLLKLQLEMDNLKAQRNEKEDRMQQLAGGSGIEEQLQQAQQKLSAYDTLEKEQREKLSMLEKQLNDLSNRRSTLMNQQQIFSENLSRAEKALTTALLERGFPGKQEALLAFMPEEQQQSLKREIDEYDQKALNIKAEKEIVTKKLKSRVITEQEWNALENLYQETTAWKEACVTKSEIARTGFEHVKSRHDRWVELHAKYSALLGKYDQYQQIQKLLKAERGRDNSFIDYIAEERLRYVAAKASQLLGVMTKHKYALELDTNAGFIIRDNANGGAHRMVSSLSGGETFLTALSLALALSEQIQLKGQSPLEFFFLDEGFGTLDNNLLDTVLDALERLSRKERVIGIISHVPEMRHRISRRLLITPPSATGEGSLVNIEKA